MRLPSLHFREGCLDLLLKAGADKEVICRFRRTALHYAMEAAANGKETCVDLLLKAGANREAKDTYGQTALDLATTEAIKALLRVRRMPPPPQQMEAEEEWNEETLTPLSNGRYTSPNPF